MLLVKRKFIRTPNQSKCFRFRLPFLLQTNKLTAEPLGGRTTITKKKCREKKIEMKYYITNTDKSCRNQFVKPTSQKNRAPTNKYKRKKYNHKEFIVLAMR